jgi:hypothetical protein
MNTTYSCDARMAKEIGLFCNRFGALSRAKWLLNTFVLFWILIAYVGLFVSCAAAALLPFKILAVLKLAASAHHLFLEICISLLVMAAVLKLFITFSRLIRHNHKIDIDAGMMVAGLVLALFLMIWIISHGGIPFR